MGWCANELDFWHATITGPWKIVLKVLFDMSPSSNADRIKELILSRLDGKGPDDHVSCPADLIGQDFDTCRDADGINHIPENLLYCIDLDNPTESYVSPAIGRMLGYAASDIDFSATEWWRFYVHPDDADQIVRTRNPANWPDGEMRRTFRLRHVDGHWIEVYDQAVIRKTTAKGVGVILGSLRDLSSRRQITVALEKSSRRYEHLLGALAEGVVVFGPSGEVVECNVAALKILGLTRAELSGAMPSDPRWNCVYENGASFADGVHLAARVLKTGRGEFGVVVGVNHANGDRVWIRLNAEPLRDEANGQSDGVIVSFADISELKRAEVAMIERAKMYRQMFERTTAIKLLIDPSTGDIVDVNDAACVFYGYPEDKLRKMKVTQINRSSVTVVRRSMAKVLTDGKGTFSFKHMLASGDIRDVVAHCGAVQIDGQDYIHSVIFDVTERNAYEHELEHVNVELSAERQRLNEIIWGTNVGTWEWYVQTDELHLNERWAEIIGYNLAELGDTMMDTWAKFCHPEDLAQANEQLQRVFDRELGYFEYECRLRHKNGDWVWVSNRGKVVEWSKDGRPLRMSGMLVDITPSKKVDQEIRRMAQTDTLTGLGNRHQFDTMLAKVIKINQRLGKNVVLMLLDLDHFKPVNDTFGHPVGDKLLIEVAQVLRKFSREADIITRLGGDEFAIILPLVDKITDAAIPAKRIIDAISEPIVIDGHNIHIGVSIGIAACHGDDSNNENLYREADRALYQAKNCGRNRFCYFEPDHADGSPDPANPPCNSSAQSDRSIDG